MSNKDPVPDPDLTPAQRALISRLTAEQLTEIDLTLLANSCEHFRKTARVVATTMGQLTDRIKGIPDIFYARRIKRLVNEGKLEAQGDLRCMHFSEIRIPASKENVLA